jgi:phosphohistidine phosphatase
MKALLLIRHAKSSWKDRTLADRDRPLNKRGKRDAPEMGRRLAARGGAPDLIVSSPAVRALTTARVIAEAVGYPAGEIVEDERVYMASVESLLGVIHGLDDDLDRIFLFGHNPGLTELVNHLADDEIENVPTCGVVEFRLVAERWRDLDVDTVQRIDFDYPKHKPV